MVASCFVTLRQLHTVRRSVCDPVFQTLVVSLVMSRLDCGNATFPGMPAYQHRWLQSVINAAAKLINRRLRYDPVTPLLRDLHWLNALERGDFKLAVTVNKCLHGLAPQYLVDSIQCIADTGLRPLRSSSMETLVVSYTRFVTAGDRAFSSFNSRLWLSLPHDIINATTLSTFRFFLRLICLIVLFPYDMYSVPALWTWTTLNSPNLTSPPATTITRIAASNCDIDRIEAGRCIQSLNSTELHVSSVLTGLPVHTC